MAGFWEDIGQGLSTVAPTVAGLAANVLLPGTGPLASAGVSYLMRALGIDESLPEEEKRQQLQTAISTATPEQVMAMRKADQDFARDFEEQITARQKIAADDRANARGREIAVKDRIPGALAMMLTVGFFSMLALMSFHPLPVENKDTLVLMLGSLGTGWGLAVAYYFGSSAGSEKKTNTIANLSDTSGK